MSHMDNLLAKLDEPGEMTTHQASVLMRAFRELLAERNLLRSAVDMAGGFRDSKNYENSEGETVPVVFDVHKDTRGQWCVSTRAPHSDSGDDYPSALAAVDAILSAKSNPEHELVKDHLS